MNGKENIIKKILADAQAKCDSLIEDANKRAEEITVQSQRANEQAEAELSSKIAVLAQEAEKNRLANAELESRKYRLQQKQNLINLCYQKAYDSFRNLSGKSRLAFIGNLLKNFAENGETVVVTKADREIVTQKFLDEFGKHLSLSKRTLQADGGIVLEGNGYEKDLTLPRVVEYVREQTESQVAAALFGE